MQHGNTSVNMEDADLDTGEFERFKDAVLKIQRSSAPLAVRTIGLSLAEIQRRLAPYPPQPSRTRAKIFNTYVRGIGRFPRAAFTERPGGGFKINRRKARGGGLHPAHRVFESIEFACIQIGVRHCDPYNVTSIPAIAACAAGWKHSSTSLSVTANG